MDVKRKFGDRVRELRHQRGVSQEAFADECGVHRTYMSGIERGLRNVSIENVVKIARALEVSVGVLFDWADGAEPTRKGTRTTAAQIPRRLSRAQVGRRVR